MSLGKRIAKLRKNKNMTQQELASLLFITDKTVSSYESGRTEPNIDMIVKISEIFECSAGYLIYGDINRSDIETEIKIKLSKKEFENLKLLMESASTFLKESNQIDTYYQPTYRKFLNDDEITEWIRIGQRGNKNILNYKNWHDNMYCDEYEVEVDDVCNLERIFKVLGLEKIAIVDKTRYKYFYLDKYEVALDFVKTLGYFIEIEVKNYDRTYIEEYDLLLKVAKNLGLNLNNIDKRGYPYHIIYSNKNKK